MKSFTVILFVVALAIVCLTGATRADTLLIANGGFDSTGIWAQQGTLIDDGDLNPNPPSCRLAGSSDPASVGYISQRGKASGVDYKPQLGDYFTLSFDCANAGYDTNAPADILATMLYRDTSGVTQADINWTVELLGVASPEWQNNTFHYYVASGSPMIGATRISISLENLLGAATSRVDNISFTVGVPEPSTAVLLIVGVLGLLVYAWRKRK